MTDTPQYERTFFGDEVYVEGTGKFGSKVTPKYSKGNGMNREYYSLGNIGWWLSIQREGAGVTKTAVADTMHWPHGAIGQIERGVRIPKASTVRKYLDALNQLTDGEVYASATTHHWNEMYARFHK